MSLEINATKTMWMNLHKKRKYVQSIRKKRRNWKSRQISVLRYIFPGGSRSIHRKTVFTKMKNISWGKIWTWVFEWENCVLSMYFYCRLLKISWKDKVTNEKVLKNIFKELKLLNTVKVHKLQYYGSVLKNEKYIAFQNILREKMKGKRSVGQRKLSWETYLRRWLKMFTGRLVPNAEDKVVIAKMIAKLRSEKASWRRMIRLKTLQALRNKISKLYVKYSTVSFIEYAGIYYFEIHEN